MYIYIYIIYTCFMTTLYLKSCDICQAQGSAQTPRPSFALEARLDESETCRGVWQEQIFWQETCGFGQ